VGGPMVSAPGGWVVGVGGNKGTPLILGGPGGAGGVGGGWGRAEKSTRKEGRGKRGGV
jgi:hypothetical protein